MDLPNLLNKLKPSDEEAKKFIAIEIDTDTVKVALWQSDGSHTEVISVGSIQTWSEPDEEELVTAIDTSLADAQGSIEEEPDQVIFGLPEGWSDKDGIAENKKSILKNICKKFSFHPIGYVISTEAIAHHLRDVEGGPPSAILVKVLSKTISVTLIYLGDIKSTQIVERSTSLSADIEEGLARIPHSGHLPSRIIFHTTHEDIEAIKQELISYNWQKNLSFLHVPKVESLPKEWSIKAVSVAGGAEVIAAIGFGNVSASNKQKTESVASTKLEKSEKEDKAIEPEEEPELPQTQEDDDQGNPPEEEVVPEKAPPKTEPITSDVLGFKPISFTDIGPVMPTKPESATETPTTEDDDNLQMIDEQEFNSPKESQPAPPAQKKSLLLGFNQKIKGITQMRPRFSFKLNQPKKIILPLAIAIGAIGIFGGGFFAYYTLPQATIQIIIQSNSYQQPINFTINPDATEVDYEANSIPGEMKQVEVTGTKTIPTTGEKLVGDRAKGKVIIYNRTNAPKTFNAGTVIKADSLRFTLDAAVTVASASTKENADFSITTEPSKAESLVTAVDIGSQYNLAKDTQFNVDNYSTDTFFAVADNAFTGGSSQSIQAVSEDDIDQLETDLMAELQLQLTQEASDSASYKARVAVGEPEVVSSAYSADENDEATELTLNLTLNQTAYEYDSSEVAVLAQMVASSSLPQDIQITPGGVKVNILASELNNDETASASAQVVLSHIPTIDASELVSDLRGVKLDQLESKFSVLPSYKGYEIEQKYLIFNRLPLNPHKINLRIKPSS